MLKTKLLSEMHRQSTNMGRESCRLTKMAGRKDVLYGSNHSIKYPMVALRTQIDLGPARHALSQIVVSGEMVVFPPFGRLPGSQQKSESN